MTYTCKKCKSVYPVIETEVALNLKLNIHEKEGNFAFDPRNFAFDPGSLILTGIANAEPETMIVSCPHCGTSGRIDEVYSTKDKCRMCGKAVSPEISGYCSWNDLVVCFECVKKDLSKNDYGCTHCNKRRSCALYNRTLSDKFGKVNYKIHADVVNNEPEPFLDEDD